MSSSLSEGGSESLHVFSFSQQVAIIFAAEAAALSGISILVLIVYKLVSAVVPDEFLPLNA
ncbi:hypothetical protein H1R20_g14296, partial [Candolleomyces eurysporus]